MATASERAVRTESRDVSKKVNQLESEFRDFRTEMQVSNQTLMEMLTQINARLSRLEEAGSGSQMADGRGIPVTVDADATLARNNSRYRDLETDRNVVIGRNVVVDNRFDRIECPVYDGSNAFKSWLHKCEQYLEINRIPANRMVRSVSFRLEGLALEWHQSFMEDKQDWSVSWDEYVRNMSLRFDSGRIKDPIVQNIEVSMTDDSSCALHEDINVSNPGLQLLDRPLEMVEEFEEMNEGKFDFIIEIGELVSEMVVNQSVSGMKEEAVVEFRAHGVNVGFKEWKETKKSELFDLGVGAFSNLNHDMNKWAGIVCFAEMKAEECCYRVLEAMDAIVWSSKILELMYLAKWNFSFISVNLHFREGITASVLWDFKKRKKKSLRQLVSLLVNKENKKKSKCS